MKRLNVSVLRVMAFVFVMVGFSACTPEPGDMDQTLLYGTWQKGTEYYKYLSNGTGTTWDTADDVTEDEAQPFTWTLVTDRLTQVHIMEGGGKVPKVYTVVTLTSSLLVYEDDYGKRHSFTKVN